VILWRLVLVMSVAALAQLGWLAAWRPLGLVPNLLLAAAVGLALRGTARPVMIGAAVAGLSLDLNSGAYFGLWTVLLPAAALAAKLLQRTGVISNNLAIGAITVAVSTALAAGLVLVGLIGVLRVWPAGLLFGKLGGELVINELLLFSLWPLWRWPVLPKDTLPGVRHL
jgi:hypothetical protein